MAVSAGQIEVVDVDRKLKKQQDEEKRLAEMMIPKKKKYIYDKMMFGKKRKAKEVRIKFVYNDFVSSPKHDMTRGF